MSEDDLTGRHRFVVAVHPRPFPAEFAAAGRDGATLDQRLLAHLRRHIEAQPKSSRRLMALDVDVTPRE